jgi:acetyl-CoA carboxylase carboxyltransferase component
MGAAAAVGIIHRRAIASADDPLLARERLADDYAAEHLGAPAAARDGFVDEVISPSETRARLSRALHTLLGVGVRDRRPPRSGHLTPVQPDERIPA